MAEVDMNDGNLTESSVSAEDLAGSVFEAFTSNEENLPVEEPVEHGTEEIAEEPPSGVVKEAAEPEAEPEVEEKEEFVPEVDVDDVVYDNDAVDKMAIRIEQFKKQGADDSLARYMAKIERQNVQYKYAGKTPADEILANMATTLGMGIDEFKNGASSWARDIAIERKLIDNDYSDMPDDAARKLAEAEVDKEIAVRASAQMNAQEEAKRQLEDSIRKMNEMYPETKGMKMPNSVLADHQRGLTPLEAYQKYLVEQKQAVQEVKTQAKTQAAKAAAKAPGSLQTKAEPESDEAAAMVIRYMNS